MRSKLQLPPVQFVSLSEEHNCAGFRCANREITQWVKTKAIKENEPGVMSVTCAIPLGGNRPIGVYALSTVAEEIANLPGRNYRAFRSGKHFPAMHLVWLATDHQYEDQGLGGRMVGQVIRIFADVGARIGIPHLILTPAEENKDKLLEFYGKLGFQPYKDGESMHLSIEAAIDAIAQATAQQAAAKLTTPIPPATL